MDIYGHPLSAPTREILILCAELGIEYDFIEVKQGDQPYLPEALNPLCKVPMIDDDGFMLAEVHAIQRYLVGQYGADSKLYPAEPAPRGIADQWLAWQLQRLALQSAEQFYCKRLNAQVEDGESRLAASANLLRQLLPELELALTDGTLDGKQLSLVVIALVVSLDQLVASDFDLTRWPAISAFEASWVGVAPFTATPGQRFLS